ncbi:hypothetical protein [endosymbiont GvMRE of Glomus versiforme]|uniref:hypothetical protein n=1 Tax=endosymbiont GvMRE of Glomus versiforme TaxID=2039283 RepID=UPI000EC2F2EE|nr:hypothetical protein [endosymbiont GvMRE of Glomus versiforme]RHZ36218.1 hypothetical protein GvMRE_Ic2g141 [endosymbiont GvMRE of Glomus versiforme]
MIQDKKKPLQPLTVNCFHCHTKEITVNYVFSSGRYSRKNNWGYWTENEEYENKWICDDCLVKLYRSHKWEFRRLIHTKKKQALFRQYIMKGIIDGQAEAVFITNVSIPARLAKKKKTK